MDRYVPLPPLPARISRLNELAHDLWWSWNADAREATPPIVCIAPAFSLHHALPMDCDGRAISAGDFAKEASDLGVPLVCIGLMYPRAYRHQRLSADGSAQEAYEQLDWSDAPVSPTLAPDGARAVLSGLDAAVPRTLALLGIEPHSVIDVCDEAPGVHVPSWIARDLDERLYNRSVPHV